MRSASYFSLAVLKTLLISFLLMAGLYFARTFLIPLTMAGLMVALFHPFCILLQHKKISRITAALLCMLIVLILIPVKFLPGEVNRGNPTALNRFFDKLFRKKTKNTSNRGIGEKLNTAS